MTVPSYERRSFSEIGVATTLATGINDTDTTITINSATGWPTGSSGDFYIRIESEDIRVDTRSSTTLTVLSGGRGANGTTAASHTSGVAVTLIVSLIDIDEANYAVSKTVGKITAAGQVLVGDAANSLAAVQAKTSGQILVGNGTTLASVAVSGDATLAANGTLTIANDSINAAKIAADAVGSSEIAADAVGNSELADAAVDIANLASGLQLIRTATSAPSSPVNGQLWWDTDDFLLYVYNGTNWVCITPQAATVATSETTTSGSYGALSTAGPAVTVTTGTKALVRLTAELGNSAAGNYQFMSFAVSGASTVAASDARALYAMAPNNNDIMRLSAEVYVTGLTAGANTFTAQYKRTSAGTATFVSRTISVVGIP